MAVLEDPDHRAERRGEAQDVEHERLDRHDDAAEHEEQQHERRHRDQPDRERQPAEAATPWRRRARPADPPTEHREGRVRVADCRRRASSPSGETGSTGGHDREPGGVVGPRSAASRSSGDVDQGAVEVAAGDARRPGRRRRARESSAAYGVDLAVTVVGVADVGGDDLDRARLLRVEVVRGSRRGPGGSTATPGSTRSSGRPNSRRRNGAPSRSKQRDDHGRDRDRPAHHERRDPVPDPLADRLRLARAQSTRASRRWARGRRAAPGRTTTAPAPASSDTPMPAYANERRNASGNTSSAASDTATVSALNATVSPGGLRPSARRRRAARARRAAPPGSARR